LPERCFTLAEWYTKTYLPKKAAAATASAVLIFRALSLKKNKTAMLHLAAIDNLLS
jgi:hypothetical protein